MSIAHLTLPDIFPIINIFFFVPIWIGIFTFSIKQKVLKNYNLNFSTKVKLWLTNFFDYLIIAIIIISISIGTEAKNYNLNIFMLLILFMIIISALVLIYLFILISVFKKQNLFISQKILIKVIIRPILTIGSFSVLHNLICYNP